MNPDADIFVDIVDLSTNNKETHEFSRIQREDEMSYHTDNYRLIDNFQIEC